MASEHLPSTTKPRLPNIQTMFLSLLGCTAKMSPVEDMGYMTVSRRLALNTPVALEFEEQQPIRTEETLERVKTSNKKKNRVQSVIIGSPSGFQHEFHVSSESELHELESLRQEVERRVHEAAVRHAELNALARRKEQEREEGVVSPRMGSRPSSGIKRKPVPSLYPYSGPASWSSASLSHFPSTARSSRFSEPGTSTLTPSLLSEGRSSESSESSLGDTQDIHGAPSLSCDETESSESLKSSCPPSTPELSSPHISPMPELSATESQFLAPLPPVKDTERALSPQPSIAGIDTDCFGVDIFPEEETLTIEAGQIAKDARSEMLDHIRTAPTMHEPDKPVTVVTCATTVGDALILC